MAKKMRDKIKCFADTFNYNTNTPPHTISKTELMESTLFLDSMPNEFSFSVSGANADNLIDVYISFRQFVESSEKLSEELESVLFAFFCYIYIKAKNEENQELIDCLKNDILPTIPQNFANIANEIVENDESFRHYSNLFSTQKYIFKCSELTANTINNYINKPENSQLRSIITNFLILEKKNDSTPQYSFTVRFAENDQKNSPSYNLNILRAEVKQSTLASVSSNMDTLYFVRDEFDVYKLNISAQKSEKIYTHPTSITTISASSKSSVVFTGDVGGNARLWSTKCSVTLPQSTTSTWSSDFAPCGGFFAFGSSDNIIRLYDTPRHRPVRYLVGHTEAVTDIKFHHNCFLLASCAFDSTIRVWDPREAKTVRLWISKSQYAASPIFSWDGKLIAFSEKRNTIVVGDLATSGEIVRNKINEISDILSLYFSTDNKYLYIIGRNGEIVSYSLTDDNQDKIKRIWNLRSSAISSSMNFSNELFIATSKPDY